MRTEPLELAMAGKTAIHRDATRPRRSKLRLHQRSTESLGVDAIDAAFAGLPQFASRLTRIDAAADECKSYGGEIGRRVSSAVVNRLAAQLESLDRQREQLAELLRDINVPRLAD